MEPGDSSFFVETKKPRFSAFIAVLEFFPPAFPERKSLYWLSERPAPSFSRELRGFSSRIVSNCLSLFHRNAEFRRLGSCPRIFSGRFDFVFGNLRFHRIFAFSAYFSKGYYGVFLGNSRALKNRSRRSPQFLGENAVFGPTICRFTFFCAQNTKWFGEHWFPCLVACPDQRGHATRLDRPSTNHNPPTPPAHLRCIQCLPSWISCTVIMYITRGGQMQEQILKYFQKSFSRQRRGTRQNGRLGSVSYDLQAFEKWQPIPLAKGHINSCF